MNPTTPPVVTIPDGGDDTARWLIAAAAPLLAEVRLLPAYERP